MQGESYASKYISACHIWSNGWEREFCVWMGSIRACVSIYNNRSERNDWQNVSQPQTNCSSLTSRTPIFSQSQQTVVETCNHVFVVLLRITSSFEFSPKLSEQVTFVQSIQKNYSRILKWRCCVCMRENMDQLWYQKQWGIRRLHPTLSASTMRRSRGISWNCAASCRSPRDKFTET